MYDVHHWKNQNLAQRLTVILCNLSYHINKTFLFISCFLRKRKSFFSRNDVLWKNTRENPFLATINLVFLRPLSTCSHDISTSKLTLTITLSSPLPRVAFFWVNYQYIKKKQKTLQRSLIILAAMLAVDISCLLFTVTISLLTISLKVTFFKTVTKFIQCSSIFIARNFLLRN